MRHMTNHSSWQLAYHQTCEWTYPGPASLLPTNQSQTRISQAWPRPEGLPRRLMNKINDYCFKPLSSGVVFYAARNKWYTLWFTSVITLFQTLAPFNNHPYYHSQHLILPPSLMRKTNILNSHPALTPHYSVVVKSTDFEVRLPTLTLALEHISSMT